MTNLKRVENTFVMMDTKHKRNINDAIAWYESEHMVIIKAMRYSDRGAREKVYILGSYGNYGVSRGDSVNYISDTGRGHGGRGKLFIEDVLSSGTRYDNKIMSTQNIHELNEKEKLPIWVLK